MPTHQGNTQTDIVIGSSGESITLDSSIHFTATYSDSPDFQYKDNLPSADEEDSSYEILISDASGVIATFAAEYTAEPITGSATDVSTTRTNTFNPSPDGNSPSFPTGGATFCGRVWEISSTQGGSTFAGFKSTWRFTSTIAAGTVTRTVNTQNDDRLKVTLVYKDPTGAQILKVATTCDAAAQATTGVTLGSPSVTDVT
ncbi:MAG TPA: hypothetical protein VK034_23785 [Enhygromyxa sp.]|nr:hypothetical protein [Enhygromyxa sp.]